MKLILKSDSSGEVEIESGTGSNGQVMSQFLSELKTLYKKEEILSKLKTDWLTTLNNN